MEKTIAKIQPRRRFRLLWLIDSLNLGGAERLVTTFAKYVDRDKIDLRVACLKAIGGNPMAEELIKTGIPVTNLNAKNLRDIGAYKRLKRFLKDTQIDIIHTHLTYADIWGRLAGKSLKVPVVSTIHVPKYFNYKNPRPWDLLIEGIATHYRKSYGDVTLSVSDALAEVYLSKGFPHSRMQTLYNGIDLSRFTFSNNDARQRIRAEFGIMDNTTPLVITVSVLREGKGLDRLLKSAEIVLERIPKAKFLVVGAGPLEESLKSYAEKGILKDYVIFTGYRNDIPELLAAADLFALPSENDPLPTVTLEAMAMRLPVVGMHSGGIPEMVIDGKTGLLVHSPDSNSFAEAIVELLSSFERLKTMGEESYKHVQEKFRASLWAGNLQKVYQKVLQKKICVVEFPGRGGMIHYAYQLCTGLFKVGFNVTLVTGEDYELDDMPHNFKVEKILKLWNPKSNESLNKLVRFLRRIWRSVKYYYSWIILFRYIRREKPDIVQFGEIRFPSDWFPLQLIRFSASRLTDICHNISPFDISSDSKRLIKTSAIYQNFYKRIYKSFSEIFVHSQDSRKKFLEIYRGNPERIHVIPHGNQNMFLEMKGAKKDKNTLREKLNIPEDARVVLFFGTITKYKGVEDLLTAFVAVRKKIEKARLVIVGFPNADTDPHSLFALAQQLGISKSVTFHLKYISNEEVPALFHLADIVVYPYRMIYQSGAIQVAYSFGKAVVATKVGGLPEVVNDNQTGLLVEPNDMLALSETIIKLLNNPGLSATLGAKAKEASETVYSWEKIGEMIKEVYA